MPFSTSFLLGRSADYTQAEIQEFERRVRNFSLFDRVTVAVRDQTLAIEVQEKFILATILNFTSGSSPQDLNATGGLVEYNIAGGPIQRQSTRTERRDLDFTTCLQSQSLGEGSQGSV